MFVLTSLVSQSTPLACLVYNLLENLRLFLKAGGSKTSFGEEITDRLLEKFSADEKKKHITSFHIIFCLSLRKLEDHLDGHPTYQYYKAAKRLQNPSPELFEEWMIYTHYCDKLPTPLSIPEFWNSMKYQFPSLSRIVAEAISIPTTSVNLERNFSLNKHHLNDRMESLTEQNTKRLVMLYFNGDIEGCFK